MGRGVARRSWAASQAPDGARVGVHSHQEAAAMGGNFEKRRREVESDFLNADLETGFALARSAEQAWREGDWRAARRSIEDARAAMKDAARLCRKLNRSDKYGTRLRDLVLTVQGIERRAGFFVELIYN